MCGTEYDFGPQGDVEKIHAAPLCRKRTGLYARKVSGSVFVFFMDPPVGTCEKDRRCSVGKEPSTRKVCIFHGIIIHYLLKKQGDYYYE